MKLFKKKTPLVNSTYNAGIDILARVYTKYGYNMMIERIKYSRMTDSVNIIIHYVDEEHNENVKLTIYSLERHFRTTYFAKKKSGITHSRTYDLGYDEKRIKEFIKILSRISDTDKSKTKTISTIMDHILVYWPENVEKSWINTAL